jgi:hypothetical protein
MGKEVLSLTMDSGAAESVTNMETAKDYAVMRPPGPESDTKYILPGREIIENQGEEHIKMNTWEGNQCFLRVQVTDVRKSLMSVGKVCDEGHRVFSEAIGGFIVHVEIGQRTQFERRGGMCVLDVKVKPQKV